MATPRKFSKLSLKKNVSRASTSSVAPPPLPTPPPPANNGGLMRSLLLQKCNSVPPNLGNNNDDGKYSIITIMSEDESQQAKLRTPEHVGTTYALEELLQQLEGNAQANQYDPDRVIATPHITEMQTSPPSPPPSTVMFEPPPPPPPQEQQHLSVERYRTGEKNMAQMIELYADQSSSCPRGPQSPKTPQELADRSYAWLQNMVPDYQARLDTTRSNIVRLEAELAEARSAELKLVEDMIRIQDYLNFVKAQQRWGH